jgi:large subunit ribosomal protein L10
MNAKELRIDKQQLGALAKGIVSKPHTIFVSHQGLNVETSQEFRGKLQEVGANCTVLKNTLVNRAIRENGCGGEISGDIAAIYDGEDVGTLAKTIKEFGKVNEQVDFRGAVVEGKFLDAKAAKELAGLPTKPEMQSQLIGVIIAPAQNLVNIIHQSVAQIVNVLHAYEDKLKEN